MGAFPAWSPTVICAAIWNPACLEQRAGDVMTANPKTIRPQALAAEAVAVMNKYSITGLFVAEDGKPAGILHIHDCLRAGIV